MNIFLCIQVGLREILAHKFRSFLTMLGIILGVSSLVTMFATVEGMTHGLREYLTLTGGVERFAIIDQDVPVEQQDLKILSPGRTMDDVDAIRRNCPLVVKISPEISMGEPVIQLYNKTARARTTGINPEYSEVFNFSIEKGRAITDLDNDSRAMVCVIGWPVWENLGRSISENPVGKTIKINNIPFLIVGVYRNYETELDRRMRESGKLDALKKRAKERRSNNKRKPYNRAILHNNVVSIPIQTMLVTFRSASLQLPYDEKGQDNRLSSLYVKVNDSESIAPAIEQIRTALLKTHRGVEDFGFDTREDWAESIEESVRAARLSGGIMSGITLLIGGIGIANIMLASISERIREFGIRMSVGARSRDIFTQIFIESMVLGVLGGWIGLAVSPLIIRFVKDVADLTNEPIVTPISLIISFLASVLISILAGFFPAWKASRLDPIQALRYE